MRSHWIMAALLSSAIAAGCNGRTTDNTQNSDQNQQAADANAPAVTDQTVAPAAPQQPYSTADNTAVPTQSSAAPRATTGRREPNRSSAPTTQSTYNNAPANAPAVSLPARETNRAAEAPAARVPEYREITIPAGTSLPLQMTSTISSGSAQVEAPVSAKLTSAISVDGSTVIPSGSVLRGNVTDVERAGRVKGRSHVTFSFSEVSMNGGREDLRTNPLTFEGEATKGEDATKVGAGAVGGAILGGILGGKKGAAKGTVAGAAAGTGVVLATRGEEVTVSEGTDVTATLAQPMTVRVRIR